MSSTHQLAGLLRSNVRGCGTLLILVLDFILLVFALIVFHLLVHREDLLGLLVVLLLLLGHVITEQGGEVSFVAGVLANVRVAVLVAVFLQSIEAILAIRCLASH